MAYLRSKSLFVDATNMPGKLLNLYELCLQSIARLLKNSYWNPKLPICHNPFIFLPTTIVDTLIVYVTRYSKDEPLKSSDLQLLITSGRVREFILKDDEPIHTVFVNKEHLHEILAKLSLSSLSLTAVKINLRITRYGMDLHSITCLLNTLLSEAPNIKQVESNIEFDLHVLQKAIYLENLVICFPIVNHIYDFLEVNGQFESNTSLKYLDVLERNQDPVFSLDLAVILTYCVELIAVTCDISKALENIHVKDLHGGSLTHKYKIQQCSLGNTRWSVVSRDAIRIASMTCPDLQSLNIFVNDRDLPNLKHYCNLKAFTVEAELKPYKAADFTFNLQSLLEKPQIGYNLVCLIFNNFTNIDFSSVATYCPNLEVLKAKYEIERSRNEFPPSSFKKLRILQLHSVFGSDVEEATLVGMLSNAVSLKRLNLRFGGRFSDEVLDNILKKNSLSSVEHFIISGCSLSLHGIHSLVSHLTSLKCLNVYPLYFSGEAIFALLSEMNLRVNVNSPGRLLVTR